MSFRKGGAGKKRDANEKGIVKALEAVGAQVFRIGGRGLPDLLVYRGRRFYALEVKSAIGRLTPAQMHAPWLIVQSESDALRAIGVVVAAPPR